MAKRMLADALWSAANKHLMTGQSDYSSARTAASCHAVADAIWRLGPGDAWARETRAMQFLRELGCDTDSYQFRQYKETDDRQSARYMWLLLAMHVAEDEGIEV